MGDDNWSDKTDKLLFHVTVAFCWVGLIVTLAFIFT